MKRVIFIEGMMCMHCAGKVKKAMEELGGSCEVILEEKKALTDTDASDETIRAAIEAKGFRVSAIEAMTD